MRPEHEQLCVCGVRIAVADHSGRRDANSRGTGKKQYRMTMVQGLREQRWCLLNQFQSVHAFQRGKQHEHIPINSRVYIPSINSRTFVPYALGPALMARGRFGAVCLAAARPMLPQRPTPKLHNINFCPFPTPSTTCLSLSCQVVWGDVLTNLQKEKARKRAFKVSIIRFPVNIFRFRVHCFWQILLTRIPLFRMTGGSLYQPVPLLSSKYQPLSRGSHQAGTV